MRILALALFTAVGLVASCSSSTTNEAVGGGPTGGASGAGTGGTSGAGGSGAGASGGASGTGGGGGTSGGSGASGGSGGGTSDAGLACPTGLAGPVMVAAEGGKFCIDKTEVTNEQYGKFLSAAAPDAGNTTGLSVCGALTDHVPGGVAGCPGAGTDSNYPVRCIHWCSAYAYCKWAGKRLCGNVNGQKADVADVSSAGVNEWFTACAGQQGLDTFPYGTGFEPASCATTPSSLKEAGNLATCEAFSSKALDMSGNVAEWEDACVNESAEGSDCNVRGGSYLKGEPDVKCGSAVLLQRGARAADVGFRCCWEP